MSQASAGREEAGQKTEESQSRRETGRAGVALLALRTVGEAEGRQGSGRSTGGTVLAGGEAGLEVGEVTQV